VDDLNDILGDPRTYQSQGKPFCCQRSLWRWLEQDGIARNDGWEDRIDRNQVREAR
jgi:hypothetical protein